MPRTVQLLITGHVQGVGYRWWTTRTAQALGLDGWVRNLHDGRVEILAHGSEGRLNEFREACTRGPSGAEVLQVASTPRAEVPPQGFHQVATASEPLNSR